MREHDIALVVADTAGRWPVLQDVTADFVYVRLHGDTELYASGYSHEALRRWAERIRAWSAGRDATDARRVGSPVDVRPAGRDVYVYFDNDGKTHAPFDAMNLASELGLAGSVAPRHEGPSVQEEVRTGWVGWGARGRAASTPPSISARRQLRPRST